MGELVEIKGIRDGLLIRVSDNPEDTPLDRLQTELAKKQAFLQGSRIVVEVGYRSLSGDQIAAMQQLFDDNNLNLWAIISENKDTREATRQAGLATRLAGSATDLDGNTLATQSGNGQASIPQATPQANALLLNETLRSGRSVWHDGHVIILGDVNPGAEVIAAGNVVVWGRLRGVVHAGALGNSSASICALDLSPMQLRIADQIAVAPVETGRKPVPEQAFIIDGQIIAEPWKARHGGT